MPFSVIGDPGGDADLALAAAYVEAGADVLEFGFPFSDPPADGPVIQAADARALAAGMTPPAAFAFLDAVRARHGVPVVLLMYYNLILQYGLDAFYARAAAAGSRTFSVTPRTSGRISMKLTVIATWTGSMEVARSISRVGA